MKTKIFYVFVLFVVALAVSNGKYLLYFFDNLLNLLNWVGNLKKSKRSNVTRTLRHNKENINLSYFFFSLKLKETKREPINWQMTKKCTMKLQTKLLKVREFLTIEDCTSGRPCLALKMLLR